jgi:hypothetical protein
MNLSPLFIVDHFVFRNIEVKEIIIQSQNEGCDIWIAQLIAI